jgi:uncharacterized protein YndB with AHSA1/START domain
MTSASEELRVELRGVMPAPPQRVFSALIEPAELARWWGPNGFSTPEIELDLRVGGRYRFAMQPPDGELFYLQGEFVELDPPNLVAYTFRWEDPDPDDVETVAKLTLREVEGGTELSLDQGGFATEARRDLHQEGWGDGFEKLRRLLSDTEP